MAFSGSNYDRWAYEQSAAAPGSNDTALNKLQHKFWVTKQAVVRKLGKDEDEHVVSSDSELDAKLELFRSIHETTCRLQRLIEHYQDRLCNLSYEENALGRFLKEHGKADKTKAGKMMVAVGKTMSYSGQQRLAIRVPLVRLYQEVETFRQRAIEDTNLTVKSMEKCRTEYRGALMWMQNVSKELDPDTYKQLEKFRKVQGHVKQSKGKFDKRKLDTLQKVDLLAAARCNMFSHALIMYQNALILFWEKTAKTMNHVNDSFQGYQHYEFSYIKDLVDPNKEIEDEEKKEKKRAKKKKENNIEEGGDEKQEPKNESLFFDLTANSGEASKGHSQEFQGGMADLAGLTLGNTLGNTLQPTGGQFKPFDEALLDLEMGKDGDEMTMETLEDLPMLTPSGPLNQMTDQDDARLLEEIMNGPAENEPKTGFAAQWNQLFGSNPAEPNQSAMTSDLGLALTGGGATASNDEFGGFVEADKVPKAPMGDLGLLGVPGGQASSGKSSPGGFLPSQLFDKDHSLYSDQRKDNNVLQDFPMPSPAKPAALQKQLNAEEEKAKAKDMSQWFSLFADLDPLANPDAIGKTTKEEDKNCYS